jgi:pyruvate-formate lyase-activating enzyme
MGLPLAAARASQGEGCLVFDSEGLDGAPRSWPGGSRYWQISFSRDRTQPHAAQAGSLFLRHGQRHPLSPGQKRALAVVQRVMARLDPTIPACLDSPFLLEQAELSLPQQLAFAFPFCTAERWLPSPGGPPRVRQVLVRVTSRCQLACPFCSAPPATQEPSVEAIRRLIQRLDRHAPEATVTLTGGEPTLRPELSDLIKDILAPAVIEAGRRLVVQTNALSFADPAMVQAHRIDEDGLFFVSLHGVQTDVYDRCTGTRGRLDQALAGVDHLVQAGQAVTLNCVVTRWNVSHLRSWVETVASRWGSGPGLRLHFSALLCPDHRSGAGDALVRYQEVVPALSAAFDRAAELGLHLDPLLTSSHAALPPCQLPPERRLGLGSQTVREALVADSRTAEPGWVKAQDCQHCQWTSQCLGVPRAYASRFGLAELRPIEG